MYKYVGRTRAGTLAKGTMEGTSEQDVQRKLREKNISPREIIETKPTIFNRDIAIGSGRIKNEHFVIYCRQFATLIRAGVSILEATTILAEQTEAKQLKIVLEDVRRSIIGGVAFSDAAGEHPKVFPALFVNLIRAGEMTGNLDEALEELASYYEKQHSLKKKVQATLAYPTVLSILIVAVIIFLIVVIIPQFSSVYDQFGGDLPGITQFVLLLSEIMQTFWWLALLIGASVVTVCIVTYQKNARFHYYVQVALLKMPIFGKLLQKTAIARMTRSLSSLFSSAVPILDSLGIVAKVVDNPVISRVVLQARHNLEAGGSLSEPLKEHWVFPPLVYQMVQIGEQTGTLDYMLDKVAEFYEEEVDRSVEALQSVIEPIMIVLLAFVVGFVVLSIMLPMLSIFTEIQ